MKYIVKTCAVALTLALSSLLPHGAAADSTTHQALVPDTIYFDLAPAAGGEPYRIFLRVPKGSAPADGWPVLYILDANAVIGTAVDTLRVQSAYPMGTGIADGVIVGIGYPTDEAYDGVRRSWNLVPPPGQTYPSRRPNGPPVQTGGADEFLSFIENDLKAEIGGRVATDPARQAIFGHSFGGLFVLHALFKKPEAFTTWIAASPSISWEGAGIIGASGRFVARADAHPTERILLLVGEHEQTLAPFQRDAPDAEKRQKSFAESRTVDYTKEMAERLSSAPGVSASFQLLDGENHMSVLPASINLAIRFAFGR